MGGDKSEEKPSLQKVMEMLGEVEGQDLLQTKAREVKADLELRTAQRERELK